MNLRLFFALPLTSGLIKKIAYLEEDIDKKFKIKIPWIPLKNLHLTVLFLGHISLDDYLKIKKNFINFFYNERLNLTIERIDYGPPGKKRMIWLYIKNNDSLKNLKRIIENKLKEANIDYKREERDFLPHINLSRLKNNVNFQNIDLKKELNWQFIPNRLVLYRSILYPTGAHYEKLLEWELNYLP